MIAKDGRLPIVDFLNNIPEEDKEKYTWQYLIGSGMVEYLDANEEENVKVANYYSQIRSAFKKFRSPIVVLDFKKKVSLWVLWDFIIN